MAVRRLSSIIAILLIMAIGGFLVICSMSYADAMVDPSETEETAKAEAAASESTDEADSDTDEDKTSKSQSRSDGEDVVKENAFSTPGNADLGDAVKSSSKKDFYTIRTENDNTYYLVIDHAGNMDNVYMLSTIDENDLKDFIEEGGESSGSAILPEKDVTEEESKVKTPEEKEPEKNRTSGIISLVFLLVAGGVGFVLYKRYRRGSEAPEEDYSEDMEGDGLETVNEDESFLEEV